MKMAIIVLSILITVFNSSAQPKETIYLDANFDKTNKKRATYTKKIKWDDKSKTACEVKIFKKNSVLLNKISYSNYSKKTLRDTSVWYRSKGLKSYEYVYNDKNKKSKFNNYNFDGSLKTSRSYSPDGISYTQVTFSPMDKKSQKQKSISYTSATLESNILTKKKFKAKDSIIETETIYNVDVAGDLERIQRNSFYERGNIYYREFTHNDNDGLNEMDSLYSFYESGQLRRKEYYAQNLSAKNVCFNEDGSVTKFSPMFEEASFPNGENAMYEWLGNNIEYPKTARINGTTGTVYVQFIVCTDGSLCEFEVAKGVTESLDTEVLRALKKMPNWQPGKIEGEKARRYFTLPVSFMLED